MLIRLLLLLALLAPGFVPHGDMLVMDGMCMADAPGGADHAPAVDQHECCLFAHLPLAAGVPVPAVLSLPTVLRLRAVAVASGFAAPRPAAAFYVSRAPPVAV